LCGGGNGVGGCPTVRRAAVGNMGGTAALGGGGSGIPSLLAELVEAGVGEVATTVLPSAGDGDGDADAAAGDRLVPDVAAGMATDGVRQLHRAKPAIARTGPSRTKVSVLVRRRGRDVL
jgi:hypothetical protein